MGYKPPFVSSNAYLQRIKREFGIKKLGYSGTLDVNAQGVLVIATGAWTRLLGHLRLSPKVYVATLWLGAESRSLDMEQIVRVSIVAESSDIKSALEAMKGEISYTPPVFSARKSGGKRAYKLAREGKNVALGEVKTKVFDIKLLNYSHPFLSFEISVEKGAYIRSLGEILARKLGACGALSNLVRLSEGAFRFENYKCLNPLDFLPYPRLDLREYEGEVRCGKKLMLPSDKICKNTRYIAIFDKFFSIIEFSNEGQMRYILNEIGL